MIKHNVCEYIDDSIREAVYLLPKLSSHRTEATDDSVTKLYMSQLYVVTILQLFPSISPSPPPPPPLCLLSVGFLASKLEFERQEDNIESELKSAK